MTIKKVFITITLSMTVLSALSITFPEFYSQSIDIPLSSISKSNSIDIYDENMPKEINYVVIFGFSVLNDTNVMNIRETRFSIILKAADTTKNAANKIYHNSTDSMKRIKTVYSDNPPTYITPLYSKNINPELYDFYLNTYNDSIHKWLNGRNNKFIRQISGYFYAPDFNWFYCPWTISIWNSAYLPDSVKFVNKNLLSTNGCRTVNSIDEMERIKEGTYTIKSGLLQPSDSVYVSIGVSRNPRYESVIKFIDLRNPDNNRHAIIESNDSVRVESWLSPKSRRLATLAKKYGKIISKRLGTMKEKAKKNDTNRFQFKYWTDLMIIPAKR